MALSSLSGTGVSDLSQALFKHADKDGDHKVSADEFKAFLNTVLGALSGTSSSLSSTKTTAAAGVTTTAVASTDGMPYAPIQGFDFAKLSDASHVNDKYTSSVRLFSQALAATGAQPTSSGLQSVVDWLNAHGATASMTKEMLSINGDPAVDVITDFGGGSAQWWFHNLP